MLAFAGQDSGRENTPERWLTRGSVVAPAAAGIRSENTGPNLNDGVANLRTSKDIDRYMQLTPRIRNTLEAFDEVARYLINRTARL